MSQFNDELFPQFDFGIFNNLLEGNSVPIGLDEYPIILEDPQGLINQLLAEYEAEEALIDPYDLWNDIDLPDDILSAYIPNEQIGRGLDPPSSPTQEEEEEEEEEEEPVQLYKKVGDDTIHCKKFKTTEHLVSYESTNERVNDFTEANSKLHDFIHQIFQDCVEPINDKHKIRLVFEHTSFTQPVSYPFLDKSQLTEERVWKDFEKICQSKKKDASYLANPKQALSVNVMYVELLNGGGQKRKIQGDEPPAKRSHKSHVPTISQQANIQPMTQFRPIAPASDDPEVDDAIRPEQQALIDYKHTKNSATIIDIKNNDNLCLLRAALCGHAMQENSPKVKKFASGSCKQFNFHVEQVAKHLKFDPKQNLNFHDLKKIEDYLGNEYEFFVIEASFKREKRFLYKSQANKKYKKFIYLLLEDNHFSLIASMKSWMNRWYFCDYCKKGFNSKTDHACIHTCKACFRRDCEPELVIKCKLCNLETRNDICRENHNRSVCSHMVHCDKCGSRFHNKRIRNHVCGKEDKYCKNCRKVVKVDNHVCYILTEEQRNQLTHFKKTNKFEGYIFFDFEAFADDTTLIHTVNLAMAQLICKDCLDIQEPTLRCEKCRQKYIFPSIKEYVNWANSMQNTIHIAHNLKSYDGHFIIKHLLETMHPNSALPKALTVGNKFLSIEYNKNKWLDSHLFIPSALSVFPKAFGLTELKKGFFPHLFNKPENQDYTGPYPSPEFYQPQFFSPEKRDEFEKWYKTVDFTQFNFKKEFEDYCWSDVTLLTEGCLKFRRDFMEISKMSPEDPGVDPFQTGRTLPSYCNHLFRRNYMAENSISVIEENHAHRKTSRKAVLYLRYIAEKNNIKIKHAKNGGEVNCAPYLLDGVCEETMTIYEFQGCYYHGCLQCFSPDMFNNHTQMRQQSVFNVHQNRILYIKRKMHRYKFVELWEHDWDRMVKEDENLKKWILEQEIKDALDPRDALFGGRTEAFKLYYKCKPGEKIRYIDYTSLYPWAQKYGIYPLGAHRFITENFEYEKSLVPNGKFFGLIKCKVLAPRNLYMPVLPGRFNKKLVFATCSSCAIARQDTPCTHTASERMIEGTWCSLELDLAVEKGYEIIKIYEVLQWDLTTQIDPQTKQGGLFTSYINAALKEKQEASGYPANCTDPDQYIRDYYDNEGILLDKNKIKRNPGRLRCGKLMCNSLWGYLAMRLNKGQTKWINSKAELDEFLLDQRNEVTRLDIFNPERDDATCTAQVCYTCQNDSFVDDAKTNVSIANFVTAQARIKLYGELSKLNERVLYCDTDSIIYIERPGEYNPSLGDYLGQFTDEIDPADGNYIEEFVSAGPKNYAYKLDTGYTHCTVKGFTLNSMASMVLNFNSIKRVVTEDQSEKILIQQQHFQTKKFHWSIKVDIQTKQYGFVYDKRILFPNFSTLPFGY